MGIGYCTSGSRCQNYSTRPRERSRAVILRTKSHECNDLRIPFRDWLTCCPHLQFGECILSVQYQKNTTPARPIGNLEMNPTSVRITILFYRHKHVYHYYYYYYYYCTFRYSLRLFCFVQSHAVAFSRFNPLSSVAFRKRTRFFRERSVAFRECS
jgi:hypothetical protein